jgi:hypothetical protein
MSEIPPTLVVAALTDPMQWYSPPMVADPAESLRSEAQIAKVVKTTLP